MPCRGLQLPWLMSTRTQEAVTGAVLHAAAVLIVCYYSTAKNTSVLTIQSRCQWRLIINPRGSNTSVLSKTSRLRRVLVPGAQNPCTVA